MITKGKPRSPRSVREPSPQVPDFPIAPLPPPPPSGARYPQFFRKSTIAREPRAEDRFRGHSEFFASGIARARARARESCPNFLKARVRVREDVPVFRISLAFVFYTRYHTVLTIYHVVPVREDLSDFQRDSHDRTGVPPRARARAREPRASTNLRTVTQSNYLIIIIIISKD